MNEETFIPQRTIVYNKHLPYFDRLKKEAADFLSQIKYNLGRAVLLQEINPGLLVWCNHLQKYLRGYGHNFSKEDHILLIKLLYQLLTIPNLEAQFVKSFAYVLHKLLKKRELLTRDDLELQWRPLYELVESVRYSHQARNGLKRYQDKFLDSILQVIRFARCYFPVEATEEMLLEWRPLMCPHDDVKRKAGYYFSMFVPAKLDVRYHDKGYKLWLTEFLEYWFTCTQTPNFETLAEDYSRLFMRASEFNVGHIDWNPYLPKIFNVFLSGLNLPVNGAVFKGNPRYKVICMNNYAKWFVYMIGGSSTVLEHLEKLFIATKSFYHPSNHGKYSVVLLGFLHSLTVHLVKRLHNERFAKPSWINEVMESHKITDAEIEKFVMIVKDVTLFSMYSKSGSFQAASAIQNIALLRADLILPSLLDRNAGAIKYILETSNPLKTVSGVPVAFERDLVSDYLNSYLDFYVRYGLAIFRECRTYEALETLVEPHQVTATLACITSVARVLVTGGGYLPEAPTHILRLLYLVLPGIDPNDFRKSMASFTLISSIIGLIPLVDCTPALHAGIEMNDIERELCLLSAQFEDFVLQFIDRCFVLIEMSTVEDIAEQDNLLIENMSAQENMLGMGMLSTVQTVLMQSSPKMFESILNCMFRFISSRVLEVAVAGKMVSDLCRAASKANPEVTLKKFVPFMCTVMKNIASVPGVQDEEHADSKLLWYLELLSEMVRCDGKALLKYKDMLKEIIHLTIHLKCKKAYSRAGKLLKAVLKSCCSVYVTEWYSISQGFETSPDKHFYIRDWGKHGNVDDLEVSWHVPSVEELEYTDELLREILLPEIEVMKKYMSGSSLTRDELHQRLQIIGVSIVGTSCILPVWENEPVAGQEPFSLVCKSGQWEQFSHITTTEELEAWKPCITRKSLALLTHELFEYMQKNNDSDTKAFRIIAKMYDFLLLHHGLNHWEYQVRWKTAVTVKKVLADQLHGNKLHLRAILIERVQLQHDMRLISKRLSHYTVMDEIVINDLVQLSTSDYTEVRVDSQKTLFGCFDAFDFSVRSVLPSILKNLQPEHNTSHERLKGTLYIFLSHRVLHLITQFWEFMGMIWPALAQLNQSEKPSIIELTNRVVRRIESRFETLSLKRSLTPKCFTIAEEYLLSNNPAAKQSKIFASKEATLLPSDEFVLEGVKMLAKCNADNEGFFNKLADDLMTLVTDPQLHWRCVEIGMKLLVLLLNHEVKVPVKFVDGLLGMLVHDSRNIRMIAIKGMTCVLLQHKRVLPKRKIPLSDYGVESSAQSLLKLPVGDNRDDNKWLQYRPKEIPSSQEDLEKTVFIDKTYIGYYCYPTELETYESHKILNKYTFDINHLSDVEQTIYDCFSKEDFLTKFFKFMSLENKKGEDSFRQNNFLLYKGLFRNFQSEILRLFENYMHELLNGDVESKHRCCAEVLAGMISGSKNWNFEQLTYLWNVVGALLRKIYYTSIMPEMLRDWGHGLLVATGSRDPNRLHQLFNVLLENPLCGNGGSLGDSSRLYILQSTISEQEWRAADMFHDIYNYLVPHLSHPFKSVRDRIGFLLSYLFIPDLFGNFTPTRSPRLTDFVDHVYADLELTCNEILALDDPDHKDDFEMHEQPMETGRNGEVENSTFGKNGKVHEEDDDKKRRDRVAKTVLSFLVSRSFSMQPLSKDIFRLIQVLIPLEAREDDPEIVNFCKITFPRLSSKKIPNDLIETAVSTIMAVCNCKSWNARRTALNFLKNMIYHNLFTFNKENVKEQVVSLVLTRLQDEQLEVREDSSTLLSGLIHFGYIPVTKELLDGFLKITHQKVRRIRHGVELTTDQQQKNVVALRLKHGGILGLSACVLAYPYVVPLWMPEILLEIGKHLHSTPQVQEVVKKTLSEFRRTHHDNWHMHRQQFTDDQLSVLTDLLISPSYYA